MSFKDSKKKPQVELKTYAQDMNKVKHKEVFHAAAKRGDGIDADTRALMQKMLSGAFAPAN